MTRQSDSGGVAASAAPVGSAPRWWWTVFKAVGWYVWPALCLARDYEPPYIPGMVRCDPPDSFVVCVAWCNVRLKVGYRMKHNADLERTARSDGRLQDFVGNSGGGK